MQKRFDSRTATINYTGTSVNRLGVGEQSPTFSIGGSIKASLLWRRTAAYVEILKGEGAEDNVSDPSSSIANAYNEL